MPAKQEIISQQIVMRSLSRILNIANVNWMKIIISTCVWSCCMGTGCILCEVVEIYDKMETDSLNILFVGEILMIIWPQHHRGVGGWKIIIQLVLGRIGVYCWTFINLYFLGNVKDEKKYSSIWIESILVYRFCASRFHGVYFETPLFSFLSKWLFTHTL